MSGVAGDGGGAEMGGFLLAFKAADRNNANVLQKCGSIEKREFWESDWDDVSHQRAARLEIGRGAIYNKKFLLWQIVHRITPLL